MKAPKKPELEGADEGSAPFERRDAGGGPQPDSQTLVLVLSERPEFFAPLTEIGHDFLFWRGDDPDAEAGRPASFSGRLDNPATYDFPGDRSLVAIIDFSQEYRIAQAVRAIHAAVPDTAFLVLYEDTEPQLGDEIAVHCVRWAELLRGELDEDIARVQTRKRVLELRNFAEGATVLPILVHADPDPDAIASAFAVRVILRRRPDTCPIVTPHFMTRPENRRMADLLNIRITEVSTQELARFERIVCVDSQPPMLDAERVPRIAVIDHHPAEKGYETEFCDIRPSYGAAATILTEYLRADDARRIGDTLATALLYAIKTDTLSLTRGVSPADVASYGYLQTRADMQLVRRIEQPSNPAELVRLYGRALHQLAVCDGVAAAFLGNLPTEFSHIMADLADYCLTIDGIVWSAVGACIDDAFIVTLRHDGGDPGAGALAHNMAGADGSGGGHATMARAKLSRDAGEKRLKESHEGGERCRRKETSSEDTAAENNQGNQAWALRDWVSAEIEKLH